MGASFNRYVRRDQTIIDNKKLKTLERHSYTLGRIDAMLKDGATAEQIATLIEQQK